MKFLKDIENIITILLIVGLFMGSWFWSIRNELVINEKIVHLSWSKLDFELERQLRIAKKLSQLSKDINLAQLKSSRNQLITLHDSCTAATNSVDKIKTSFELSTVLNNYIALLKPYYDNNPDQEPDDYIHYYSVFSDLVTDIDIAFHRFTANVTLYNMIFEKRFSPFIASKINHSPLPPVEFILEPAQLDYVQTKLN